MAIYGERAKELKDMDRLRRHDDFKKPEPLTAEEKAKKLQEMQAASLALNE